MKFMNYESHQTTVLNPCLRHFGNVMERHLWTRNPQLFFTRIIYAELRKKSAQVLYEKYSAQLLTTEKTQIDEKMFLEHQDRTSA